MGLWVENGLWYVQFPCGGFGDSELERAFLKLYLEKFAMHLDDALILDRHY